MRIRRLEKNNSAHVRSFINFPFDLYRGNKYWVPAFGSDIRLVFNEKAHPFYQHSKADFFQVESEGQILGQMAALHNINYSSHHHQQTAFFYYFDCINDAQASQALFDAAVDWARTQGCQVILGPRGFLRSNGIGLLAEGFDNLPAVGIAYNHAYYDQLVKQAGFEKRWDYFSGYLEKSDSLAPKIMEAGQRIKERGKYWIKVFKNKREMRTWIPRLEALHQEAFQLNDAFYPSTKDEFSLMAANILQVARPGLIKLIMKEDQLAGFVFCYPNITRAIQKVRGELWPFGWYTILREMNHPTMVDLNGVGILPAFQGMGANLLLYTTLAETLKSMPDLIRAEFVQVNETNFRSKSDAENIGVRFNKIHRVYQLAIN